MATHLSPGLTRPDDHNLCMWARQVKELIDPIDFFQRELTRDFSPRQLHGWVDGGLCPFHDDAHVGTFVVNLDHGAFSCFECNASGVDVIAFRMMKDCIPFHSAVASLADQYGVRK